MDDKTTLPDLPAASWADSHRSDPVERLDEATTALTALQENISAEEPLDQVLQRLAETAATAVQDADVVTVTVDPERPRTAAATNKVFVEIDEAQFHADRGPCLEAARTLKPVRAVVGENARVWPEFESCASRHGVRAYLSVPSVLPASDRSDARHVGSLNIYSYSTAAFDPFDEGLMRLFSTAASASIGNSHQWQRSREHVKHLEAALVSRAVIDQAKGVLMAVHACTADDAFAMLVQQSQRENRKLRDVAEALLRNVTGS
ncbi:ANTAR domain-containing protein [Lentzea sp. NPDC042327]|uniref:ANTAR domain-containing protein n=1 Tax=Lentzea sp. NPDC042327 TaxID=3154801 RepID=UPI0033CAF91F